MTDKIFKEIEKDLEENVNVDNKEFDYLLTFTFDSLFMKKQSEYLLERLLCLLPGVTYEKGNAYERRNTSEEYNSELKTIIYKNKYRSYYIENSDEDVYLYFAFDITKPTYKWIISLERIFKTIISDIGCKFSINGTTMSNYPYPEENDFYKFGFLDSDYINVEKEKELQRKIIYSKATLKIADAIALEMIDYKPNTIVIAGTQSKKPKLKRFDISYNPIVINIPSSFFISEFWKEAILLVDTFIQIIPQTRTYKAKIKNIAIEFIRIYECDERYIFVALEKPSKPRDADKNYNYQYFYYTFWIDKGNYLTDDIKLKRNLVGIFGEEIALKIEKEINEQNDKNF